MTDKPDDIPLEFKDWVKAYYVKAGFISSTDELRAAWDAAANAQLRRLHAENEKFHKRIESQNDERDQLIDMAERLEAQRDELLEALKEAVDYLDCNSWVYRRASAAIAKVKGEKQ